MDFLMDTNDIAAYIKIESKFIKMEGFFKFDISAMPEIYERRYAGDEFKSVSVSKSKTKISYAFDRMKNSLVHDFLANIADLNLKGDEAKAEIALVDFSKETENGYCAVLKTFSVLTKDVRPEDGFLDYSGTLLATSDVTEGFAKSTDNFKTIEFFEKRRGILCDLNS